MFRSFAPVESKFYGLRASSSVDLHARHQAGHGRLKNYRVHPTLVISRAHEVRLSWTLYFISSAAAPPYFPMRRVDVDGAPRRLLDGALVANNPTQFALAEAASLRRRKNRAKAVGKEDAQLDLVVSLGTGSAPARATSSSGAEVLGLLSAFANLAAARDFVSGIIDLLTDTDATHDLVRRQLRDTWPSSLNISRSGTTAWTPSSTRGIWGWPRATRSV